ncbi:hypothetical protein DTG00_13165 [Salmonella enterica subsp. enterica]|nr:hypothetical protein [Salmonella enterica subsp. enterica]MJY56501.1 hypothetical protein [Salmonella enterica subsp. enterica serovar Milwaukee]
MKGALKLARVWRKITTTPGLSDKDARPVKGRTRHTGSGWAGMAGAITGAVGRRTPEEDRGHTNSSASILHRVINRFCG